MRRELLRLQRAYPPVHPQLVAWLLHRAALRDACGEPHSVTEFLYDVLFFVMWYVDDGGLGVVDDPLHDEQGRPVIVLLTDDRGVQRREHQGRAALFFDAVIGVCTYLGYDTPSRKRMYPCRDMPLLGIGLHLDRMVRYLEKAKAEAYGEHIRVVLEESTRLPNGTLRVIRSLFNSLVHRLIHASEVIPLMRSHLFYSLKALRGVHRLQGSSSVIVGEAAQGELRWCQAALVDAHLCPVPMASRHGFPCSTEPGVLTIYSDASRELDEQGLADPGSGLGAWALFEDVFYYVVDRWSDDECAGYSINVLEFATELMGCFTLVEYLRSIGASVTHVHTFVDNTSAEFVSERGRTQTAGMNYLNTLRQHALVASQLSQRSSRVASIFNDIADLLSRGEVEEALRFARDAGVPVRELAVLPHWRSLDGVPRTWD